MGIKEKVFSHANKLLYGSAHDDIQSLKTSVTEAIEGISAIEDEILVNTLIKNTLDIFQQCTIASKGNKVDIKSITTLRKELSILAAFADKLMKENHPEGRKLAVFLTTLNIEVPSEAKNVQNVKNDYNDYLQGAKKIFNEDSTYMNNDKQIDNLTNLLQKFLGTEKKSIPETFIRSHINTYKSAKSEGLLPEQFSSLAKNKGIAIGAAIACVAVGVSLFSNIATIGTSLVSYGFSGAVNAIWFGGLISTTVALSCCQIAAGAAVVGLAIAPFAIAIHSVHQSGKNSKAKEAENLAAMRDYDFTKEIVKIMKDASNIDIIDQSAGNTVAEISEYITENIATELKTNEQLQDIDPELYNPFFGEITIQQPYKAKKNNTRYQRE